MRSKNIPTFVYFARRADGEGPVKIGCSYWPTHRLMGLMCWSPYRLDIVATVPGDENLERRFHAHFEHLWSHGEWFRPAPELTLALAELATGVFDLTKLPEKGRPAGHSQRKRRQWTESQRAKTALSHITRMTGHDVPAELYSLAAQMDGLSEAARAEAWRQIAAHRADPSARGVLIKADWARNRYAEWLAKRPLPTAKAA